MTARDDAARLRRAREVALSAEPMAQHCFYFRGRRMTVNGSASCCCPRPTPATCSEPCPVCGGTGPHAIESKDGALRCTRCTYVREVRPAKKQRKVRAGERDWRTW